MVNRTLLIVLALGGAVASAALYVARSPTKAAVAATTSAPPVAPSVAPSPPPPMSGAVVASPELERLAARRELYESVDALVQASEFERARRLLDEAQARFGDDSVPEWRDLEESYRIIADCLERPSVRLRARAQAFVRVSEAQSLKPRIRAACQVAP